MSSNCCNCPMRRGLGGEGRRCACSLQATRRAARALPWLFVGLGLFAATIWFLGCVR